MATILTIFPKFTNQRNYNQNREDFSRRWPWACLLNAPSAPASTAPSFIRALNLRRSSSSDHSIDATRSRSSVDRYLLPAPQPRQASCCTSLPLSFDGTDRQTDRQTDTAPLRRRSTAADHIHATIDLTCETSIS